MGVDRTGSDDYPSRDSVTGVTHVFTVGVGVENGVGGPDRLSMADGTRYGAPSPGLGPNPGRRTVKGTLCHETISWVRTRTTKFCQLFNGYKNRRGERSPLTLADQPRESKNENDLDLSVTFLLTKGL